jgi:5-methylcytosine-specific restriction endonuclease McrA
MNTCKIDGCPNKVYAKEYCKKHHKRFWKHGDATITLKNRENWKGRKTCIIDGCNNFRVGFGYCRKHYKKFKRYGDPLVSKLMDNTGKICLRDGCNNPAKIKGYCRSHYRSQFGRLHVNKICSLPYCSKRRDAKGYCSYHYHLISIIDVNKEFEEIFGYPPYICYICGRQYNEWHSNELELDHVIPKSNGGSDDITNLLPTCKMCNRMKDKFLFDDFVNKCKEIALFNS